MALFIITLVRTLVAATVLSVFVASPVSAAPVSAAEKRPRGVVELFTSQGCSSCPPADRVLSELVAQGDVIALAYHVDYWDNLGWKDTLGSARNTARQYDYAHTLGRSSVYTPQAVINGRDHINGADRGGINAKVDAFAREGSGLNVALTTRMDADRIRITVGEGQGKANVIVVYYDKLNTVAVKHGENQGKTIDYWNAVRDIQTIAMWDGEAMALDLPSSVMKGHNYDGCTILLQRVKTNGVPGEIIGAATVQDIKS
tara:strand:+ start:17099 stop:17872 length:774 start_codon:yes stop_codon:yes gene_type:complete